jgi:glycosyltransferase involved in cell wall biosynthesis
VSQTESCPGGSLEVTMDARMAFHSGIGRYIRGLSRSLSASDAGLNLTLLVRPDSNDRPWQGLIGIQRKSFDVPIYSVREQIQGSLLGRDLARRGQLLHFPHYNSPWGLPSRSVVTIHDLTHLDFPQFFNPARVRLAEVTLRRAVKRAGALIAVSNATRAALLRRYPACEAKLHVVGLGVDDEFHERRQDEIEAFRARHGLGRFILFVGSDRGHKNLAGLLTAYSRLIATEAGRAVELVVIGDSTIDKAQLPPGVRLVRDAGDTELALWYSAARLLCIPSINEGFGLPALEAMACGTPVVASDIDALRDLVGDAGILVPPMDLPGLTAALERILSDRGVAQVLGQNGVQRAKQYTWERTARQTLEIYRGVVSQTT